MNELIFGRHAVLNSIKNSLDRIEKVWILDSPNTLRKFMPTLKHLRKKNIAITIVNRKSLDRISDGHNHQGIVARIAAFQIMNFKDWSKENASNSQLVLLLDQIQDPRNLGAIYRSASAANVDTILLPKHGTAPLSNIAMKASAGTIGSIDSVRINNPIQSLQQLKKMGFWIIAITEKADNHIFEIDLIRKCVFIFGSEGKGIRSGIWNEADIRTSIPLTGPAGSINVASAAAIALYERLRQKWARGENTQKKP